MAFEEFYQFIDLIVDEYKRTQDTRLLMVLTTFDETILKNRKWKSQKAYNRKRLVEVSEDYARGYFGERLVNQIKGCDE